LIIQEIDQISITVLVDNTSDFLLTNSEHAIKPPFVRNEKFVLPPPVAEHGFSAFVTIPKSKQGASNSFDHFAGLANILRRISSSRKASTSNIDVFAHPDAFVRRWEIFPDGTRAKSPVLDEQQLQLMGAKIHKNTGIRYLPNGESHLIAITGEIPRETSFERGFPYQYAEDQVTK
jgi:7,8-dihydropterin-6-yl-methyl-4-(beta-D-ribofuranosyl)aminobenzene 5'-phosphate synthase